MVVNSDIGVETTTSRTGNPMFDAIYPIADGKKLKKPNPRTLKYDIIFCSAVDYDQIIYEQPQIEKRISQIEKTEIYDSEKREPIYEHK